MPDLLETQRAFAAALRSGAQSVRAATLLAGDAALTARRLAVYRGNVVANAAKALGAAFPVAKQVVGDEFFEGLARRYWQQCPSTSGDLHDYGRDFSAFIAEFAPARDLPYLSDLTRLEWNVHEAYCAASAPRLDPSALSKIPEQDMGSLELALLPGTALLRSAYPVVQIWTIHQAEYEGTFEVDWNVPQRALVAREGLRVTVSNLGEATFALYQGFAAGMKLAEALGAAQLADPKADLIPLITGAVASGPIAAIGPRSP